MRRHQWTGVPIQYALDCLAAQCPHCGCWRATTGPDVGKFQEWRNAQPRHARTSGLWTKWSPACAERR